MHIALYTPGWPIANFHNGVVTYVHWMKLELESMGHRISVFSNQVDSTYTDPNTHQIVSESSLSKILRRFRPGDRGMSHVFERGKTIAETILRVHRHLPIDVVEMEESFGWFSEIGRITGIPVVAKLHGPAFLSLVGDELNSDFARQKIAREGLALSHADAIVSPSSLTLKQTLSKYSLRPRIASHIVNPVTLGNFAPLWDSMRADANVLLFVGRFDLRKGADVILQAFGLLARDRPLLRLVFVGPDIGIPDARGNIYSFASYCASHLPADVRSRINYVGVRSPAEVAELRAQAAVTVIASRWESQGYTVLEALMQGCPVVSSDAGALPENIEDGVTGSLARSESPDDFACKIATLLDDVELARHLGQAGRAYVSREHSAHKVALQSLAIYKQVANLRR